ncbi:hypothetical protein EYC79_07465 [Agrobacterium cavarae]|uniref:Uncharacterized protein n=1 Tax=Agrobacterium cavarae TaxID=2528239 RepID=A0ABY1YBW6_9HYPH|nr:hypothetical protein [Agrobacterium cavarae]TBN14854.1 hypothetical protein EYC79_07465 [Agrobacterium cavarae]
MTSLIDVWDITTFDADLMAVLQNNGDVLLDYELVDRKNYEEQQGADRWVPLPDNPFAIERMHILEEIVLPAMEHRTIRAWHYTRLTDAEADCLRASGIHMSDATGVRRRLNAQVEAGAFDTETADAIYRKSPFHSQADSRSGKFWMVSHPYPQTDGGVELLLQHWGGEGVYFWLTDPAHIELVQKIGRPRILEVAVPLFVTTSSYSAAKAVVSTYVESLGARPEWSAFDLYATSPLGKHAILGVHTIGDASFAAMARGYPAGFANRN